MCTALVTLQENSKDISFEFIFPFGFMINWTHIACTCNLKWKKILSLGSGSGFGYWYGKLQNFLHPQQFLITDFDNGLKGGIQNNDLTGDVIMSTLPCNKLFSSSKISFLINTESCSKQMG